jgi:polygalacturonase
MSLKNPRRQFLKTAGTIAASGAILAAPTTASIKTPTSGSGAPYDVKAFGAKGDGKTLDTATVNRAVEAAAHAGGGTVVFPSGNYLCHSIHLRSNVALQLNQGSTIVAADSSDGHAYDLPESNKP